MTMKTTIPLETLIDQARGRVPADLVLRGGMVLDTVTGDLLAGDVAICGETIVGICDSYEGREVIDVSGKYLVPGFIDTHLHIESSCVTPSSLTAASAPRA